MNWYIGSIAAYFLKLKDGQFYLCLFLMQALFVLVDIAYPRITDYIHFQQKIKVSIFRLLIQ
jgi:hypothetical protein